MTSIEIDLTRSVSFDIEEWINSLVASVHTTPEEFARLYILEVHPVAVQISDLTELESNEIRVKSTQTYVIRRKTPEEMAAEEQPKLTQGVN
jgi:hypothetical protein